MALPLRHKGVKGGRRCSSYSLLTSKLDGVSGQRHAPAALYLRGKDIRYPLNRSLGGSQIWSGHRGKRKILCICQGSNPGRPVCSQTLHWLSYPSSFSISTEEMIVKTDFTWHIHRCLILRQTVIIPDLCVSIYISMVYLTTLSRAQIILHRIIRYQLHMPWKERVVSYYSNICLE
jgi:hypothetical protein